MDNNKQIIKPIHRFLVILFIGLLFGYWRFSWFSWLDLWLISPYILFAIISLFLHNFWAFLFCILFVAWIDFVITAETLIWPSNSTAWLAFVVLPFIVVIFWIVGGLIGALLEYFRKKYNTWIGFIVFWIIFVLLFVLSIYDVWDKWKSLVGVNTNKQVSIWVNGDTKTGMIIKEIGLERFNFKEPKIDVNNDGKLEIIAMWGWFSEVWVKNSSGKFLWKFKPKKEFNINPNKLTYWDLNHDWILEFYAADSTGLYQLDINGGIVWWSKIIKSKSWKLNFESFSDVNIVDTKDQSFIVGLTELNSIEHGYRFFDFNGNVIKKMNTHSGEFQFEIVNFKNKPCILIGYPDNQIVLLDLSGSTVLSYSLKDFPSYHSPKGVSVKFDPKDEPYLAISSYSSSTMWMSKLTIFSSEWELVYEEVLDSKPLLKAKNVFDDGTQILQLSNGTVYKFRGLK